jgi:uncharacterized protein involved in exopolysaccharide biosynthesis/Mrp family chromosome partitioning ATPase
MLVYDQPTEQSKPEPAPATRAPGINLFQMSELLWRRRATIAAAAVICAFAAVVVGKGLTPRYTASAQLYVDPRELQLVERELTPRAQDVSGLSMVVESQARLITSNSVLLQVVRDNRLDQDPEFGGFSASALSSVLGLFGLDRRDPAEAERGQTAALEALNRHITIRKSERSFIVDIEVWSKDPAKAAQLANAISMAYLAESKQSQATAARRATNDLSGRLKELQARLRNAENTLAVYKAQNNFVGTQDTLISDQQLSASNQRLAAARAMTLDAQAKYDQIEASRKASTDGGAIPEALQSPTIANLRAQYAEARKKYAETAAELGPRHPALRQTEKQVEDLRKTINEEIDRFAQSAKNDLTRARDYEASLNRALEAQKRQSVQLSQASVRLRELERDVEASRDVYQSFLKRSRETEEQESLNTSAARITGEAIVPQRRSFPPAMSFIALLGLVLGALAAIGWIVAVERLPRQVLEPHPDGPGKKTAQELPQDAATKRPIATPSERPLIARLQEADVLRTLGGILALGATADIARLGWPTLRAGAASTPLLAALREMRASVGRRAGEVSMPAVAVIGIAAGEHRSIAALNFALAAARDGASVLLIDADHGERALSHRASRLGRGEAGRLGWLSIGSKAARAIKTDSGISILPAATGTKAGDAIVKAIAQARSAGGYDLVVIDGPAMPAGDADARLLAQADAIVAILPASLDINDSLEQIITALGGAERKLAGVIINEIASPAATRLTGQKHA